MKIIILAGGKGEKIWPYNEIRNKCMIPISNKPIIQHLVEGIQLHTNDKIHIVGTNYMDEINHLFKTNHQVNILTVKETNGNVETLLESNVHEDVIVLFGDCLIDESDIKKLLEAKKDTILMYQVQDDPHNHILGNIKDGKIESFIAYPRGYKEGFSMVGGYFSEEILKELPYNRGRFKNTKVGVGSPNEKVLEESLNDYIQKQPLKAIICEKMVFDIDKPWHILCANAYMNQQLCGSDEIHEEAFVDESLRLNGHLKIGRGSKIGKNVYIKGNVIIGEDTIIDNGVVIEGDCIIGDRCTIQNHCKIGAMSTIGNDCIIEHTAELLGGILMDKNYLYHHMEFYGICGERCDLGAGSICGTLRFDDGDTIHVINGRKEIPLAYSNATFLGDYTRAGVGAIFLPGATVGVNCVIGAGTIINQKVKSNTLIYAKQELIEKEWSYKKYGW